MANDSTVRPSPRRSSTAWAELVRGRSVKWSYVDLHAAEELRRTLNQALLHQTATRLAHLSTYDALTELANRSSMEAK